MVAVHNDYRLNGENYTFWLLTKDHLAIKAEGKTDAEVMGMLKVLASTVEREQDGIDDLLEEARYIKADNTRLRVMEAAARWLMEVGSIEPGLLGDDAAAEYEDIYVAALDALLEKLDGSGGPQ